MKLAEALLLRAELQKKVENLQSRILANLKVQEGDTPHENPSELLEEAFSLSEQLCALIKQINHRNNLATLPGGIPLSEALAERDLLLKKRNILSSIAAKAQERDYRLTHAEVKMQVTLPVGDIQRQMDKLAKAYRELDTQIQAVNWTIEL